jgi:hypothetical protein
VTLKFSKARPYFFPSTARRLKGENKRRVTNVKGAERISFSVRHAAFLLFIQPLALAPALAQVLG